MIGFGLSPRSNGPSQTAPIPFIAGVGAAYRASGRTTPIMDQLSVHPYPNPNSPTDAPDVGYAVTNNYGVSNLDRVKQAVYDAFNGTGQPTTVNGLTFRIDELGWQTDTTSYPQYYNQENVKVIREQQQADYLKTTAEKYFACDPTVTDVELFLLGTSRPATDAVRTAACCSAAAGRAACSRRAARASHSRSPHIRNSPPTSRQAAGRKGAQSCGRRGAHRRHVKAARAARSRS